MEKLIPFINEIHDIIAQAGLSNEIQLPQIVVLGSQSVGKSSVLESIMGKDFLPRGKGIVTRRPIEIQLINIPKEEKEYVVFSDHRGDRIYNLEDVRKEIDNMTEKLAGKMKAISPVPIRLKFYSPNVVDLLIVDLPGMTKNPVGEQPKDIELKIRELIKPYVDNPNSLVLALSKANDDLANSEALKLAREVDPDGIRTVGVITHLDLMDQGTDALNELNNKIYPLKLGYVGVVCRGQRDIEEKKSIQQQVLDEKEFFDNHKSYQSLDNRGIPYLVKTLNLNFLRHIKRSLPNIRDNLIALMKAKEFELYQYGDFEHIDNPVDQGRLILAMVSKFAQSYSELIKGKYLRSINEDLSGGARINYIFNDIFKKAINGLDPFEMLSDQEIRIAIKNANGLKNSLFVNEVAFENLIKKQILRLRSPCLECAGLVHIELRKLIKLINIPELERFQNMTNEISKVMEKYLQKCLMPTEDMIKNLIEIELGYINTNHPDFCGGANAMLDVIKLEGEAKDAEKPNAKLDGNNPKFISEEYKNSQQNKEKESGGYFFGLFTRNVKNVEMANNKLNQIGDKHVKMQDDDYYNGFLSSKRGINDNLYDYPVSKEPLKGPPNSIKLNPSLTNRELTEIATIKKLMASYFDVVKKNINDTVPKTVITFLINQSKNGCERELISNLYDVKLYDELLKEDNFILDQRKETKKIVLVVRKCLDTLNDLDTKFNLGNN